MLNKPVINPTRLHKVINVIVRKAQTWQIGCYFFLSRSCIVLEINRVQNVATLKIDSGKLDSTWSDVGPTFFLPFSHYNTYKTSDSENVHPMLEQDKITKCFPIFVYTP